MKSNKELNQQVLNTAVDKKGRPTINIDERKSIYNSISEALKAIPITNRNVGLTIPIYNGIKIVEYWWEKGIKDSDFVKKINGDDIPRIDAKLVDLQNQIDGINNIEFKIFDSLPELGDSSIIYVIPNTTSQEDDNFIEYFWIKSQQRYERFGGLNVDGGVTINNFYTFDNNVFTIDEESNFKNVSLNSKKIGIGDKSIEIYKYDIGEENNERKVLINTYSRVAQNRVYDGGEIKLNGFIKVGGNIQKEIECQLYPDGLNIICTQDEIINRASLIPQSLTIEQDTNKSIVTSDGIYHTENENDIFEASRTKLYANTSEINLYSSTSFDIRYNDDYGIKGFSDNNIEKISLYGSNNEITITNSSIQLSIARNSFVNLTSDIFNAKFNQLIYLNAPTTRVKKILFDKGSHNNIYLEPYYQRINNVIYLGLKSETDIYINELNNYFVKSQTDSSLTSYGLNGIKHRNSNVSANLGYNILNIGDGGTLSLGMSSELTINESTILLQQDANQLGAYLLIDKTNNEISLQKGNNRNDFIKIDKDSNIILKNGVCEIKMIDEEYVSLIGYNGGNFTIDQDGWCIIKGYEISKIGLLGTNNKNSYFLIKKEEDRTLPDVKIYQNLENYIHLYKNDNTDENCITIQSDKFDFINNSNEKVFTIEQDDFIIFRTGNQIIFKLGSKTITLTANGISDGTNTKTWAQIFS